jgi:transmembrane sensor
MDRDDHADRRKAAARWYAELQSPEAGDGTWDAFRIWEQDPANAAAFREIESALATLDRSSFAARRLSRPKSAARSQGLLIAAAAVVIITLLGLSALFGDRTAPVDPDGKVLIYATMTGEQRRVDLADGSTVELNTASRIEVDYSESARLVRLTEGQAIFDVEPDELPFLVEAAGTQTRALGTEFEVYVKPGEAHVTLLQGKVSVMPSAGLAWAPIELVPGDRLVVAGERPAPVTQVDLAEALSWRTGVVQFTDVRLVDAVQELNRYSRTKIVVDDPSLEDERLSGAFKAGDQEAFVEALDLFLSIEVERSGGEIRIAAARD